MAGPEDTISIQIGTDSTEHSETVQRWLSEAGATVTDVTDNRGKKGILPLIPIVIAAAVAAGAAMDFVRKWRIEHQSEQIITYRDGELKIQIVDKIKNGKIIILAAKDTVVQIDKEPDNINLTDIAKTALSDGADAAKEMIDKAGGKATVTQGPR
jgi:hypothetical protein